MGDTVTNPATGQVYRRTALKVRSAEFTALKAAEVAARAALSAHMRSTNVAFDIESKTAVNLDGSPAQADVQRDALVAALQATITTVRQYKTNHPGEFQAQQNVGIPIFRAPVPARGRGRGGRGRGRGGR